MRRNAKRPVLRRDVPELLSDSAEVQRGGEPQGNDEREANLSDKRDPRGKITPHFSWWEFDCSCGCKMPGHVQQNIRVLCDALEASVRKLGPVTITSGYRCESHNKSVGGAQNSRHLTGEAADLTVVNHSAEYLAGFLRSCMLANIIPIGGLGLYKVHPNMVHYDVRGRYAVWKR